VHPFFLPHPQCVVYVCIIFHAPSSAIPPFVYSVPIDQGVLEIPDHGVAVSPRALLPITDVLVLDAPQAEEPVPGDSGRSSLSDGLPVGALGAGPYEGAPFIAWREGVSVPAAAAVQVKSVDRISAYVLVCRQLPPWMGSVCWKRPVPAS
jgi:hypothetical protein